MATSLLSQTLNADAVRAAVPNIRGPIVCGWQINDRALIVEQCRDAFAVIVDGTYIACCQTESAAIRAASKALAVSVAA